LEQFNKGYQSLFETRDSEGDEGEQPGADGFTATYGWIYNTKSVAEHEGITLEEAFNLKAGHFLNDLSYLKAKEANDKKMMRDARTSEY
jgi:hypothetical protein